MSIRRKQLKIDDVVFNIFNGTFMLILAIVTLYPFINTIAVSFNNALDTIRGGIYLWPREFSLQNYKAVFFTGTVYNAFLVSVARTVLSTVLNLFLTTMLAYTVSRKEYVLRKPITIIFVLTMYFNAGLIPNFLLIKGIGLNGSFWVYVIPTLISAFNLIVIRTYIGTIPESLVESSKIDGAGEFTIFIKVIFPLCRPCLAIIALFVAVGSWNSWFDTFIYCSSKPELSTLQYELMKLLSSTSNANANPAMAAGIGANSSASQNMVTPVSIRAAITIVAAAPIIVVYPFLQNHFVAGLNVGGVKE